MNKHLPRIIFVLLFIEIVLIFCAILQGNTIALLQPKGMVATQERNLIVTAVLLALIGIIPVYILAFFITRTYKAGNHRAKYTPDWDHHVPLQVLVWAFPTVIIFVLAGIMLRNTHALDPYKPLASKTKPLTIQVVALQWKWLFIYPEQDIATVNYVTFPEKTPINFELTADAPMNSFWIPQLGGQIYAMAGMSTKTHLMADAPGEFRGASAEISGSGFAGMKFIAKATTPEEFATWVQSVKASANPLTLAAYNALAKPSENTPRTTFTPVEKELYNTIMMKYLMPSQNLQQEHNTDRESEQQTMHEME